MIKAICIVITMTMVLGCSSSKNEEKLSPVYVPKSEDEKVVMAKFPVNRGRVLSSSQFAEARNAIQAYIRVLIIYSALEKGEVSEKIDSSLKDLIEDLKRKCTLKRTELDPSPAANGTPAKVNYALSTEGSTCDIFLRVQKSSTDQQNSNDNDDKSKDTATELYFESKLKEGRALLNLKSVNMPDRKANERTSELVTTMGPATVTFKGGQQYAISMKFGTLDKKAKFAIYSDWTLSVQGVPVSIQLYSTGKDGGPGKYFINGREYDFKAIIEFMGLPLDTSSI